MNHAVGLIGLQRVTGSAIGEITRGVALPVFPLTAYLADFRAAMTFMDRAEGRARFDGLQLLGIADQHDLGPGFGGIWGDVHPAPSAPGLVGTRLGTFS
jgi:hypothetical protein